MLAFKPTYKINKYNLSFVIFSYIDRHKQTNVFGYALIVDEKEETYKWVLKVFAKVMNNRKPI